MNSDTNRQFINMDGKQALVFTAIGAAIAGYAGLAKIREHLDKNKTEETSQHVSDEDQLRALEEEYCQELTKIVELIGPASIILEKILQAKQQQVCLFFVVIVVQLAYFRIK